MSDKDLLVVISEMLHKQDQQAEILDKHTGILKETNDSLKNFVEVSIQQFQQQQQFNEHFLDRLDKMNEQYSNNFDRQSQFNERFLDKLTDIEKALKK